MGLMLDGDYMVDDALTKESIQNADDAKASAVKVVQLVGMEPWSSSSCQDIVEDGEQHSMLMKPGVLRRREQRAMRCP